MTDKIVVLSTCDSPVEAERIARGLVEERLAACVQLLDGARSIYLWKGNVEGSSETILLIKSRRDLLPALRESLARMHSYETPEIVALTIVDGSPAYLDWMDRELRPVEP
jgi:periplasmic divalent cation tolerance protein